MRILTYIILMLCALMVGICGLWRLNPFLLAVSLMYAAVAGWALSKEG